MKKLLIILSTILGVAVVGIAVYAFMLAGDRNSLQEELTLTQANLAFFAFAMRSSSTCGSYMP